jgi:DNA-binding MarR family transcriptional regulator
MTKTKRDSKTIPGRDEINEVANAISARELPRIMSFADLINRLFDTKLIGKIKWMETNALIYLITEGGRLNPSQLARLMLRSNYSITRLVDDMVSQGLVIRDRRNKDRRAVNVKVTSAGLTFMLQSLSMIDPIEEQLMSCLDKNAIETLRDLIRILRLTIVEKAKKHIDAWIYYQRGIAYKGLGMKIEAVKDFKTCIEKSRNASLIKEAKKEIKELTADLDVA